VMTVVTRCLVNIAIMRAIDRSRTWDEEILDSVRRSIAATNACLGRSVRAHSGSR
jgi:hypothetical protein